jgi:phenylpropionate dioxygenase-like ring-hydroxylating dioxygenase large terminal subunit
MPRSHAGVRRQAAEVAMTSMNNGDVEFREALGRCAAPVSRCAAAYHHRLDAALDEDLPALESQQKGMASPFAAPGRFSVLMEPNVAAFAACYAESMQPSEHRSS